MVQSQFPRWRQQCSKFCLGRERQGCTALERKRKPRKSTCKGRTLFDRRN